MRFDLNRPSGRLADRDMQRHVGNCPFCETPIWCDLPLLTLVPDPYAIAHAALDKHLKTCTAYKVTRPDLEYADQLTTWINRLEGGTPCLKEP